MATAPGRWQQTAADPGYSSHEHPANPEWSQAAAAELYAAMVSGDACLHKRQDKFQQLAKK